MTEARKITLQKLVTWSKGSTTMGPRTLSRPIGNIWMDSRKIERGDVFLALRGETVDGHRYVGQALQAGAIAAIVARKKLPTFPAALRRKLIAVNDPLKAVQRTAATWRRELAIPIIAVTGSNGKTTTRHMITTVLRSHLSTGETFANWNNHIGVPLSLLRFGGDEQCGVVELAANHEGEIKPLSRIARPDIAVITNIGYAHIGLFGSLTTTTRTKFEIVAGLKKRGGILLLNGDDSRLVRYARDNNLDAIYFGRSKRCAVRATDITVTAGGKPEFMVDGRRYALSVRGRHFIYSALPAIFAGKEYGMSEGRIAEALRRFRPAHMRGTIRKKKGTTFIVDCYNANPSSMKSGVTLLRDVAGEGSAVAVVGDMLELGSASHRLHRALGETLARAGVERVLAVGQFSTDVVEGARKTGMSTSAVYRTANAEEGVEIARTMLRSGDTVLLKGSRGVRLEKIFEAF
ncbi:MAG: UDP-N-acetylmuramoyl-tripeptide--D-alanyl-D-alanine ligase [Chitinivibrionales bacterium]|nr:UDP-N-acetylmuramoyl-tripeptide--D-alanyl-D-alanine ligase [Chitinivibrionales bacterium]MBD3355709.1 UDP-N-acetylmuramoyl-tripeptide--D-alanyl-D-alanine ligase [Chitinivibrionales bacterium]